MGQVRALGNYGVVGNIAARVIWLDGMKGEHLCFRYINVSLGCKYLSICTGVQDAKLEFGLCSKILSIVILHIAL